MLHILLILLKIIGILLAVILGLILLIVFVVLFAALRYEVAAAADGDIKSIKANVKFSWLFHLISGFVVYDEQKLDWQVRIAWKKLNVPKTEAVQNTEKAEEIAKEITHEVVEETTAVFDEVIQDVKKESVEIIESAKGTEKTSKKKSKKQTKKQTKKVPLEEKIRCSIQKISDKIKEIKEIKDKIVEFLTAESHKKAFQKLLKELLRLLKKLKPKKLKANVEFGFEDPYKTGSILAYLSMLYPFYGDNINITPNFTEPVIKGDVFVKGHIRISYMANMGIRLILDRNIRLTIKDVMKLIAKK